MLEICAERDEALLRLGVQRGLLSAVQAAQVQALRGMRSAAVALVEDGHLGAAAVRALRADLQRHTIDHAIDGYELLGKLGSGGMSEVFKALDVVTGRLVAIKVLAPRVGGDRLFLERFHREARSAVAVIHDHVVSCHGVGETRGRAYMVLEFVPGGDLEALVRAAGGPLSEERAVQIASDCAAGLEAIHARGLVHRDIKPSNILLDGAGRAKVADLGLAKGASPGDQLTMPGIRVGSPGYISPEQAGGRGEPDIRADIYSLGATLFYLLSGRCAFSGRSPLEIIMKSLTEDPPPLREVRPLVSRRVADIVATCMARHPQDRYQDPQALRRALHAAAVPAAGPAHAAGAGPSPERRPGHPARWVSGALRRLGGWCRLLAG